MKLQTFFSHILKVGVCALASVAYADEDPNVTTSTSVMATPAGNATITVSVPKHTTPLCQTLADQFSLVNNHQLDYAKFKAIMSKLPPSMGATPPAALTEITSLDNPDYPVFHCKADPDVALKATIWIEYGRDGKQTTPLTLTTSDDDQKNIAANAVGKIKIPEQPQPTMQEIISKGVPLK